MSTSHRRAGLARDVYWGRAATITLWPAGLAVLTTLAVLAAWSPPHTEGTAVRYVGAYLWSGSESVPYVPVRIAPTEATCESDDGPGSVYVPALVTA